MIDPKHLCLYKIKTTRKRIDLTPEQIRERFKLFEAANPIPSVWRISRWLQSENLERSINSALDTQILAEILGLEY